MSTLIDKAKVHWEARDGFAMPLVLLALVVMSTIAVAALTTASDEQKSARAVREAGLAFYDAEAGLWESWANWPEESVVTAIAQGDSLDLGWQTLDNGADYRGKIHRWGPSTFGLRVESRGARPLGGQQWLSLLVNYESSNSIGVCCDGPALVDGNTVIDDVDSFVIGQDEHPTDWEDAGVCPNGLEDAPGLIMKDTDELTLSGGATLDGVPELFQDTTISEETFSEFGPNKTLEDLKNEATFTIGQWGLSEQVFMPAPSYGGGSMFNSLLAKLQTHIAANPGAIAAKLAEASNKVQTAEDEVGSDPSAAVSDLGGAKGEVDAAGSEGLDNGVKNELKMDIDIIIADINGGGDGTGTGACDTSDPLNWGSDDPNDPCFDFFRIILAQGDVALQGPSYGQGLIILDWNESTNIGTEIDFEDNARFNGLILGKGCIEVQGGSKVTGAIFADGNYFNEGLCGGDAVLDVNDQPESINQSGGGGVQWSSCVIDRLLTSLALEGYSDGEGFTLVANRAFAQLPR